MMPFLFGAKAAGQKKGLFTKTESADPGLPNYDIRNEKSEEIANFFLAARNLSGKDAVAVADIRDGFVRGENTLRSKVPTLKIEYNTDLRIPEVITPDVWKAKIERLSPVSNNKRSEILRNFVRANNDLVGMTDQQADDLFVSADYTNPDGNLSYAHLEQRPNGIPVFRSEVKAGFTKEGQLIRVINNLAPGLDYGSLSMDFLDPLNAVRAAAGHIDHDLTAADVTLNQKASNDLQAVFGTGDWATTAEKMYFPTEPGVAVPAWRVLIWQPVNAYYVIVDAATGTMLWRKNIGEDQTQSATYQVYNNTSGYILAADNPAPLSPGPTGPINTQGALATRTNVTLIGNEAPNTFNNNGWITDGANITDGNAVQAGIDRDGIDGVDAPQTGSPNRVFSSTWNPPPGSPAPGDDPLLAQSQRGAVIQMFYVMNRYHDKLYQLGFTEAARNFQTTNFTGQGVGADRVSAEGQDSSGTNNANFNTPADGGRGRMQMYLWNGPTPDYDGTADAEVIIHEVTHGTSNRLHGNSAGLSTNMSRGMGEGWSDFYGEAMLAQASDPINGVYTTGGYATYLLGGMTSNYYHGIRRFPRAPITFTGGPNNLPHNPFTFKHLNSNCDTTLGTTSTAISSAFPRNPVISTSSGVQACDQVHNAGEIWSSALWEIRNRMILRLGFTPGTTRVLQIVTDGMKLAPAAPTFLQERDAIIAAAAALPRGEETEASADVSDVREGFRVRGMGFSASIQNPGTGANNAAVTEAFDAPNVLITNPISVSDSIGDNDGFPEPGENILVSVPITNTSGATINSVTGSVTGGGSANYGNISDGATVTMQISYPVPGGAVCGSMHQITITGTSSLGALNPMNFSFRLGVPLGGAPVSFTAGSIAIPGTGTTGVAAPYPSTLNVSGLTGNKTIALELTNLNTTYPGDMDWLLVGPGGQKFIVLSDVISAFTTQTNAVVVLKDSAAAGLPDVGSTNMNGEWKPTNHGAGDAFAVPAPASPYQDAAPAGAATFASVFGTAAAGLNGTWSLYGVDDVSGDVATITGWKLTFEANDYACSTAVSVSGTITYGNAIGSPAPPRFVKGVSVASSAGAPPVGPVITGTPGTYSLTGFGAGSYTIKPTKAFGPNGSITSNDAARVAQGVSGAAPFVSQNQRFVSDASGNGVISSTDAAFIGRFAAGLSGFGNAGQWKFFVGGAPSPLPTPPQVYNDSRTYATVAASVTGEDFVGLLIGEASGNWNPATHPRPAAGPERSVAVELPRIVASADKEIVIPVNLQGAAGKEIISYEFNLRYDPTVMQPSGNPVDLAGTASRGLFAIPNPNEPGLLRIVVYGPMPISENGLLLNLRFTPVGPAGSISPLTLEQLMFNEGDIGIFLTDGQVEIRGRR